MLSLQNNLLAISIADDATSILLYDRVRGVTWRQRSAQCGYRREDAGELFPLTGGTAVSDANAIVVEYPVDGGTIRQRWALADDHVCVTLEVAGDDIACVTLSGPFQTEAGDAEIALPLYQGLLMRKGEGTWSNRGMSGGHGGFGMGMVGNLGKEGGLLTVQETLSSWYGVYGAEDGVLYAHFEQSRCPVNGWESHAVRLYPVDASLTALCKRYRATLIERGLFVTWEEKIAQKPILRNLFGALMAFTGYNQAPDLDYAGSVQRLKDYGFDRIFLYPVRMCQYSLDFLMGGDQPVWLSDEEIARVKAIDGALVAPWGWTFEGLDDGTPERHAIYRRDQDGNFMPMWKIDHFQWYMACPPYQREHIMQRFATDMAAMDWIHFDVDATARPTPCYYREHALHGHAPLGRHDDTRAIQRLFNPETVGNRIVSSEGFVGHFTPHYDIGSTKLMPGPKISEVTPVPMTMLVFHDSCVHDWWEVHNYNAHEGWGISEFGQGWGLVGSGRPQLKAALDALAGCPPNLFPFGRQYGWVNIETRETFSFEITLDDPRVQEALQAALPVAKLHQQIGRCELVEFAFLNEARTVHTSLFSDGTRIVANLAAEPIEVAPYGILPGESWRKIDA